MKQLEEPALKNLLVLPSCDKQYHRATLCAHEPLNRMFSTHQESTNFSYNDDKMEINITTYFHQSTQLMGKNHSESYQSSIKDNTMKNRAGV